MSRKFREHKMAIREFLRSRSDARLAYLEERARAGKLKYQERCECLIGAGGDYREYSITSTTRTGFDAESAFYDLGFNGAKPWWVRPFTPTIDALRNRIVLPMIRAEIRRRARALTARMETGSEVLL